MGQNLKLNLNPNQIKPHCPRPTLSGQHWLPTTTTIGRTPPQSRRVAQSTARPYPLGFSPTPPTLKGPRAPPLLRVSPHEPPFSVQKACMTQHLTALPLVRLDRRRRLRSIVKLRPPPPLQPPHGELPPLAIVVLRRWPLVSPRPPPPPSCYKTHRSSSSATGAHLPPSTAAAAIGLRPRHQPAITVSFRMPLLPQCHPHYTLKLWRKTKTLEHHRSAVGR
jgi:hypothetical protein